MAVTTIRQYIAYIIIAGIALCMPSVSWSQNDSGDTFSASRWIDREIYSEKGKQLGEIDDLIIRRNGRIKKVTIETSGFLGFGEKRVGVTLREFQDLRAKKGARLILKTTEEQMEERPEFDYRREGLNPDYYYRPGHSGRYGYTFFPPPYLRYQPYGPEQPQLRGTYPQNSPYDWAFSPARYLASAVIDRMVVDQDGAYIGRVTDLLIDAATGKVEKIILGLKDLRGQGAHVALPYEPPGFTAFGIVFDITREEMKNLPRYSYRH